MVKEVGRRTSVIVFEDLHWLDEPSQDFLQNIVKAASGTNFVVVLNYRPNWQCRWLALPHYRQLQLAELASYDTDGLVRDLTGNDPTMEKMITHVARQSAGNPFFAEELVQALARSGVLTESAATTGWHRPSGMNRSCRQASRPRSARASTSCQSARKGCYRSAP